MDGTWSREDDLENIRHLTEKQESRAAKLLREYMGEQEVKS